VDRLLASTEKSGRAFLDRRPAIFPFLWFAPWAWRSGLFELTPPLPYLPVHPEQLAASPLDQKVAPFFFSNEKEGVPPRRGSFRQIVNQNHSRKTFPWVETPLPPQKFTQKDSLY